MDDDEALECLRRKMISGRHQPSDKPEQDFQGPIFNLCEADMHDLRRLKRNARAQSFNRIKELFGGAGRTKFPNAQ